MSESLCIDRITIIGTGLSALPSASRCANKVSAARSPAGTTILRASIALRRGAITVRRRPPHCGDRQRPGLLAGPVFTILEWIDQLAPLLGPQQLVTDVGSVKGAVSECAAPLFWRSRSGPAFCPDIPWPAKKSAAPNTPRPCSFAAQSGSSPSTRVGLGPDRLRGRMARLGHQASAAAPRSRRQAPR